MFKRRFRLPSPALVISMVTLSLVLGGTAVAASTATHKDKKADTKLIKKLAPTLSVKHAKTANNATHATSADSATNATNATNADQRDQRDERDQCHPRNERRPAAGRAGELVRAIRIDTTARTNGDRCRRCGRGE